MSLTNVDWYKYSLSESKSIVYSSMAGNFNWKKRSKLVGNGTWFFALLGPMIHKL